MRTATITFHASNNNGSFFQAFAMQKVLREHLMVENQIIDFQTEKQIYQYSMFRPVHSSKDLAKNLVSLRYYKSMKLRNTRFENMRTRYLNMTPRCSTIEEMKHIADDYDIVFAGSDQIWNTCAPDFSPAYLLPGVSARKIAFSVSFGNASNEVDLLKYKKYIPSFFMISAREKQAQQYLKNQIGKKIDVTLDPTLLLEKTDYLSMVNPLPVIRGDYAFFYSISCREEAMKAAKNVADQLGLPIMTVFTSFHSIACVKHGIKVQFDAGPEEFLYLLIHAKIVLTDSLHGTAFSILFHKPFINTCSLKDGGFSSDDRIHHILDSFGIVNSCLNNHSALDKIPEFYWEAIEKKRQVMREYSLIFLKKSLE